MNIFQHRDSLFRNKKGVDIGLVTNSIIGGVIALLVLVGVFIGVTAFKNGQVTGTAGCNSTVKKSCSTSYNLTVSTEQLSNNFGAQLGTVGTMFGVSLILGAIGLLGLGIALGARRMQ